MGLDALLYLSHIPYALIFIDFTLNNPCDADLLEYLANLYLAFVDEVLLLPLRVFVEISNYLQLHVEEISNLLACSIPRCEQLDDLYSFVYVELMKRTSLPIRT